MGGLVDLVKELSQKSNDCMLAVGAGSPLVHSQCFDVCCLTFLSAVLSDSLDDSEAGVEPSSENDITASLTGFKA